MGKFTTRLPLDIKTGDPKNNHIPIYDQTRGVWNTVASSSLIVSSSVSASFATTASYVAGNVLSSSFATTASYVAGTVLSSSYALTSSYAENTKVFPFTGSADISGSLSVRTNNVFISGANEPVLTIRGNYPKINLLGLAGAGNSGSIYMNGSEVRVGGMSANTNLVFMAGGSPTWYIDSTNGDDLIPTLNDFSVYPNIGATTTRVKTIFTTNINSTNPISSSVSASYATTSSFATTASYVAGIVLSASYAATSSIATSASYALTSSFSTTASAATSITFTPPTASYALTSSFATTASYVAGIVLSASYAATSSIATSASYALTASAATSITFTPPTASYAVTSSFATTASYALTSSTATSASYALTSSFATTASYVAGIVLSASYAATSSTATSASYALTASAATSITFTPPTASYALTSSIATSASYALTASAATSITFTPPTASFAITASYVNGTVLSSSYALTSSFSTTASAATSITFTPPTASYALTSSIAASASYALTASAATSITFTPPTASYALTSSIATSASYALTASFSITASTATSITFTPPTASYALTSSIATSASYALTSSYANRATTIFPFSGSAVITGSLTLISGSINVISGSVTASLFGTASVAISSSFTTTASYALSSSFSTTASAATSITFTPPTASYALTSSIATSASYALTASAATSITFTPPTASYAVTSSIATSASYALTSSFATTASAATSITFTPSTASYALTSSIATSASYAITSSHSNRATTIFPFSGSAIITGSLTILSGSINIISGSVTGSLFGTASIAVSASFATTASYVSATSVVGNVTSASYALTSSFSTTSSLATSNISTASVSLNTITFTKGDGTQFNIQVLQDGTATSAISASYVEIQASTPGGPFYVPFVDTTTGYRKLQSDTDLTYNSSTNILNTTSSYALTASVAISASYALTSSFATTASAATSITFTVNTGSFTGSFIGTHSGSTFGTASVAVSSSFATTASYVAAGNIGGTVTSASYALTSSYANVATTIFPFSGSATITGSLTLISGSIKVISGSVTASLFGTASNATTASFSISSSFSTTASAATSITFTVNTGSFTGSFIGIHSGSTFGTASVAISSSFATTASYVAAGAVGGTVTSASYALTSSFSVTASAATSITFAVNTGSFTGSFIGTHSGSTFGTASWANNAISSSFATTASAATSITFAVNTGSFTGSFIGTHSGSTFGTSSWAVSASNATTASYVAAGSVGGTVISASYAATASYIEFLNVANKPTLVSSSIQIDHNATTNYSANRHIDHTAVSITAGAGLTGGGDISSTRTLTALYIPSTDARAVNNPPASASAGLYADFKTNTTDGLVDGGSYHGVLTFRPYGSTSDFSGGPAYQEGFTENGNLYLRSGSLNTWSSWRKLAYETGSILGSSSFATTASYVAAGNVGGTVLSASYAATSSNLIGGATNYIPLWTSATAQSSSNIYQSSGNIGIGITNPAVKLEVGVPGTSDASIIAGIFGKTGGNAYGSTVLRVARYTGTTDLTVATAVEALDLEYNSGGSGPFRYGTFADAVISNEGGATNGPYGAIHFATSGSIRMTVGGGTLAGNVGIGTTSPGQKLHVEGNIRYTGNVYGNVQSGIFFSGDGTFNSGIYSDATGNALRFNAGNAEKMRIDSAGNVGIGTTSPTSKLQVVGGISRTNTRVSDSEVYPVGHYTPGETVFEINTTWTDAELRQYFNSANVAWTSSADAPGGYAIYINDVVNVGGEYNSGFPYIPVDQDDVFYMECWIKNVGTSQTHYMGSMEYNHLLSSIGGNPGTYGYWVMSNTNPTTAWTKVSGYIKGFGTSTGQFVVGAKYWTPQALFNYTAGTGTRACVISGWKVIKVNAIGNRFFSGSVGIGTTSPSTILDVNGVSTLRGNLLFGTDNTYDIGGSGVNRPRNIYTSGDAIIAGVRVGRGLGAVVSNTAVGNSALAANTTGFDNVAIGTSALNANVDGVQNTAIGSSALSATTSNGSNTAIGFRALFASTGGSNIAIGNYAGSALTTGGNNTIIGSINGTAGLVNTIILAAGTTERIRVDDSGNMGIGTTAPGAKLHVQGAVSASSYTANGNTVWHAGNDGASSGLDADLLDGQHGSYYTTAGNLTGTIPSAVLGNSTVYVGTTAIALNRSTAAQTLTGVSIDGNAATVTTVTAANFASQTANTFLAAPNGSAGTPTFRAIVAADVPTLNQNTTGTSSNITAYTINQNLGTTNSPSFNALTVGASVGAGDASIDIGQGRASNGYAFIDLVGDTTYTDFGLRLIRTNGGPNAISQLYHRGTGALEIFAAEIADISLVTSTTARVTVKGDGNVGIGTTSPGSLLHVQGAISGSSMTLSGTATVQTLVETSTRELKKNVTPIESTITTLSKLEPSRFNWISTDEPDIGLIAEQVEQIFPELVTYNADGKLMGVKYSKLTVLLLKAVQEMSQKIERLEQQSIYKSTH